MSDAQKKPMDWKASAAEMAQAFDVPVDDLKREVQRELTTRLAKGIVDTLLKSAPFDWKAAGMTSPVTW